MSKILPFKKISTKERHRGNTLCRNGHHKWAIDVAKKFDVKRGKLITLYRCKRCAKTMTKAL